MPPTPAPQKVLTAEEREALLARRMPFMEHLVELRRRVGYMLLAVVVCTIVAWLFKEQLLAWASAPLEQAMAKLPEQQRALNYTGLTDAFMVRLRVSIIGGICLGIPVILYQIWAFVAPGLYPRERRLAAPILLIAVLLFVGGVMFAYFFVLPRGYDALLSYVMPDTKALFGGGQKNFEMRSMLTVDHYLSLTSNLLLVFGAAFELPLVLGVLALFGFVSPKTLWRYNRYAILIAFVAGAVLTPGDLVVGQVAMGGALTVLYNLSILVALLVGRKRKREAAAAAAAQAD